MVCVLMAVSEFPRALGCAPPIITTGLLFYGLIALGRFQPQERAWQLALERARLLALANFALSPFVYFWSRLPTEMFFYQTVIALAVTGMLFLCQLNHVLQRLAAMLPDETLRDDMRFFTRFNLALMLGSACSFAGYQALERASALPQGLIETMDLAQGMRARFALMVVLVLLPVSMTMSLVWKAKEVVLGGVFGPRG